MEKEFVPYEQALALKELGFDEPCLTCYIDEEDKDILSFSFDSFYCHQQIADNELKRNTQFKNSITAPTYSQTFRWFRKKYNIISVIGFYNDGEEWEDTEYKVTISEFEHFATHDTFVKEGYVTYEEAELACLKKLIQIVKEK